MSTKTVTLAVLIAVFVALVIIDGRRKIKRNRETTENTDKRQI